MWGACDNSIMQAVRVQHYIQRAADFFRGMQLTREDGTYVNSSALLAIHSALSYNDALRVGLGDTELSSEDHKSAASTTRRLLPADAEIRTGLTHLDYLISRKSLVAYGDRRLSRDDYKLLITKAERFAQWANRIGSQLNIEGWRNVD